MILSAKTKIIFSLLLFVSLNLFAQPVVRTDGWNDREVALQYALWAQNEIEEGRMSEALAGLERAKDFSNVSSDISYLLAVARLHEGKNRIAVIDALTNAIERNAWEIYSATPAMLLKAEQLIVMRNYNEALNLLDQIRGASPAQTADAAMLRLRAFRSMALNDDVYALAQFRSLTLSAMDRYPRDPRPLKIFLEFARNRLPDLPSGDIDLMELVLRRLPFLIETDPELAWMAAPFMWNIDDARRYILAYRAGGLAGERARDFYPHPGSIPVALNLGLIDDTQAADELFLGTRGINYPLPMGFTANGYPVSEKRFITETFDLLRSDEDRNYFMQKLLSFSGIILNDNDNDGFFDNLAFYNNGILSEYRFDRNQTNEFDLIINFSADGFPDSANVVFTGVSDFSVINWEQYPHVKNVESAGKIYLFRPADFQFAPIELITLGGTGNFAGLAFPVPLPQNINLTQRTLVSFAASVSRPSTEFDNAIETIFLERGVPRQAIEELNGRQVSLTEFERGLPVIQYIDLDTDGRMETIRRFRRPPADFLWPDAEGNFNYRSLIASSESDWTGEGRFKTGEMYLQDGSVVYSYDMDGTGSMNFFETKDE